MYASGDLLVYFQQGNPKKFVVPDAFVVKGLRPGKRRIYKTWVEGKAPDVVIETTSRKTRPKDTRTKPELYARLEIKEYFLFDPHQECLDPQLQGYRLTPDGYHRIESDADGVLESKELNLRLSVADGQLQFHRCDTGERLLTAAEREDVERRARQRETEARQREAEARQREAEARQHEAEARRAAEAEVTRLRAELARCRSQSS